MGFQRLLQIALTTMDPTSIRKIVPLTILKAIKIRDSIYGNGMQIRDYMLKIIPMP